MNSRGKKVLDIEWEKDNVKVKIPVKAYTSKLLNGSFQDEPVMKFRAEYPEAGIDIEETDINKIRAKVLEALNDWYTVSWELFFMVEVGGGREGQESLIHNVRFQIEFYVAGKDKLGKQRYMRVPRPQDISKFESQDFIRWGLQKPSDTLPQLGERVQSPYGRSNTTRAFVKATPENVAAADHFLKTMDYLIEKMHHHFAPERIEKLLSNPALLLPAPKDGGR